MMPVRLFHEILRGARLALAALPPVKENRKIPQKVSVLTVA